MVEVEHDRIVPRHTGLHPEGPSDSYHEQMGITVSVDIDAPLERVWREAADLKSHADWMRDTHSIDFQGDQRTGVGTTMNVLTKIGPLTTTDVIEITSWIDGAEIGVSHRGVVTGTGRFVLEELSPMLTRFTWEENLDLPWYFGGKLGSPISGPVLKAVWRGNLKRLKARVEQGG